MAASFPTSVKSFPTRSAGQTIASSILNDLQDEVVAVETALTSGLAANASLVTDGSSTIRWQAVPRAVVTNTAVQTIPTATSTVVTFDTEVADVGGLHSTSVNTGRLTCPSGGDGLYAVKGFVSWVGNATGGRQIAIKKNGSTQYANVIVPGNVTYGPSGGTSIDLPLVAGDYVELVVYQDSGGNLNISADQRFSMVKVG